MEFLNPSSVLPATGGYSHGAIATSTGRLLFISGQTPETPTGEVDPDPHTQFEQIWANIRQVLRSANADVGALIHVRTYLADRSYAEANTEIRNRVLAGHRPALTVVVCDLFDENWVGEIEAVASVEPGTGDDSRA